MFFLFVSLKVLFLVALGCKRSIVSHKDSPAAFSHCVSVCQNHTTGPETHKSRDEETLKYLNLAKINKLRYSQHILWAAQRILSSQDF